jgi:hypothetical protein
MEDYKRKYEELVRQINEAIAKGRAQSGEFKAEMRKKLNHVGPERYPQNSGEFIIE